MISVAILLRCNPRRAQVASALYICEILWIMTSYYDMLMGGS